MHRSMGARGVGIPPAPPSQRGFGRLDFIAEHGKQWLNRQPRPIAAGFPEQSRPRRKKKKHAILRGAGVQPPPQQAQNGVPRGGRAARTPGRDIEQSRARDRGWLTHGNGFSMLRTAGSGLADARVRIYSAQTWRSAVLQPTTFHRRNSRGIRAPPAAGAHPGAASAWSAPMSGKDGLRIRAPDSAIHRPATRRPMSEDLFGC